MKNVLLLTHYFYPNNHIATQRPAKLAKYLPEYGWNPLVLCTEWTPENCDTYDSEMMKESEKNTIIKALPYKCLLKCTNVQKLFFKIGFITHPVALIDKIKTRKEVHSHPERSPLHYYRGAITSISHILRIIRIDAIWATSPPAAPLAVAYHISKSFNIPWIADFRDVWEQRYLVANERLRASLIKAEPKIISTSEAIVTVSEPLRKILLTRNRKPIYIIPNGFDQEVCVRRKNGTENFQMVYIGSFKPPYSEPTMLLQALDDLISKGEIDSKTVKLRFLGTDSKALAPFINEMKNPKVVFNETWVSYSKSIENQKSANVLIFLAYSSHKGIYSGKIFEYLGSRRPILCVPGDNDVVEALLKQTQAGVVCRNVEETAAQLLRWYREWKQTGDVAYHGREEEIMKYSRKEQAGQLAKLLDKISEANLQRDSTI